MERIFLLDHLSTQQLHDLYKEARKVGTQIIEYDEPGIEGYKEIVLPEKMILENINSKNYNYMVYHEGLVDEKDCITISLDLTGYSFIHVYIEMDLSYLKQFVKNYSLNVWRQDENGKMVEHPFSKFYSLGLQIIWNEEMKN